MGHDNFKSGASFANDASVLYGVCYVLNRAVISDIKQQQMKSSKYL